MLSSHPRALPVLFLTEMWERFGFYIVQGLLILYMTNSFKFGDSQGYAILGAFTALAYINTIIGGYIADRYWGFKLTIIVGAILLIAGYALLAIPNHQVFYIALATITSGNGLFKPNISSLLGTLYEADDPRRDAGFTFFYMGINLGVILSTWSSGFVVRYVGWSASFLLASVGLVIGLITFLYGKKKFIGYGNLPQKTQLKHHIIIVISLFAMVAIATFLVKNNVISEVILGVLGIGILALLFYKSWQYPKVQRGKLVALLVLISYSVIFWGIWFQMYFSITLFIERTVQRHWFGITIPTIMFLSLESIFILISGPWLSKLWTYLYHSRFNVASPTKFCLAMLWVCLGFVVLALSTKYHSAGQLINPLWIVAAYLFSTMGEMFLSPIGLSTVTELAPKNIAGVMMGLWFVALGFGGELAGMLAKLASVPKTVDSVSREISAYGHAFSLYAILSLAATILIAALIPVLRKALLVDDASSN